MFFPSRRALCVATLFVTWNVLETSSFTISTSRRCRSSGFFSLSLPQQQNEAHHIQHHQQWRRARGDRIQRLPGTSGVTSTQLQCICIHCKYVTECSAYHFVESRHNQPHMTETPTFTPRDGSPTIHVNVRTVDRNPQDLKEDGGDNIEPSEVSPQLTAPAVTYEYDVVACQDYVEDRDCWVRNMPEAIRIANPNFVPT